MEDPEIQEQAIEELEKDERTRRGDESGEWDDYLQQMQGFDITVQDGDVFDDCTEIPFQLILWSEVFPKMENTQFHYIWYVHTYTRHIQ